MKRIAKVAVAASILLTALVSWLIIGGSTNIAFADVAKALDNVRSATYDGTTEMKNPMNGTTNTTTMKCFFLAPSRERIEMSLSPGGSSIMIMNYQALKGLTLVPDQKLATTIDLAKIKKQKQPGAGNPFEMVRKLVQDGSNSSGEKAESLGRKVIDGREAIGFRFQTNMANQTYWADPETARLVRIEVDFPNGRGHSVMSNFRYDMELDPSLFSLEPPAGYTVNNMDVKMPVEDDLVNVLRLIAEHNDGTFPAAIGMHGKEYLQAIQAEAKAESEKFLKEPATVKLLEELKAQYGKDKDKDGFTQALTKAMMPLTLKVTQKVTQKNMQGMMFYNMLTSANDSHYVGKDVKLDTPDRPIFWYKPTGDDKYRVIYADLSVKQMTADEVRKLPEAKAR
jgi:outer membrane lipoprotein-sorting protein